MLVSVVHTLLRDGEFENLYDICSYYGKSAKQKEHVVENCETADKVGSGLLPVYATPQVVALMEHTACDLVAATEGGLEAGETTVGTRMAIDHVKACLAGENVRCTAMLASRNGRQWDFLLEVRNHKGELLAQAEHTRFAVQSERFMNKLG